MCVCVWSCARRSVACLQVVLKRRISVQCTIRGQQHARTNARGVLRREAHAHTLLGCPAAVCAAANTPAHANLPRLRRWLLRVARWPCPAKRLRQHTHGKHCPGGRATSLRDTRPHTLRRRSRARANTTPSPLSHALIPTIPPPHACFPAQTPRTTPHISPAQLRSQLRWLETGAGNVLPGLRALIEDHHAAIGRHEVRLGCGRVCWLRKSLFCQRAGNGACACLWGVLGRARATARQWRCVEVLGAACWARRRRVLLLMRSVHPAWHAAPSPSRGTHSAWRPGCRALHWLHA
jgi:hypothetical protein